MSVLRSRDSRRRRSRSSRGCRSTALQRGRSAVPGLPYFVLGLAAWSVRRGSRAAGGVIGPND